MLNMKIAVHEEKRLILKVKKNNEPPTSWFATVVLQMKIIVDENAFVSFFNHLV